MGSAKKIPRTVDDYIKSCPADLRKTINNLRKVIKGAAPGAVEKISWGMPAYTLNGKLLYFAVWKNHIGFYPMASGIDAFKKELSVYKSAKGSVQFPHDKPLPLKLIKEIVKFRVTENKLKAKAKAAKKK